MRVLIDTDTLGPSEPRSEGLYPAVMGAIYALATDHEVGLVVVEGDRADQLMSRARSMQERLSADVACRVIPLRLPSLAELAEHCWDWGVDVLVTALAVTELGSRTRLVRPPREDPQWHWFGPRGLMTQITTTPLPQRELVPA